MNRKFSFINNSDEFKEKVEKEDQELKERINKFLEMEKGREFLYKKIEGNRKLREYLNSIYGQTGTRGPNGYTETQEASEMYSGVHGVTGIVGTTGIVGSTGTYVLGSSIGSPGLMGGLFGAWRE